MTVRLKLANYPRNELPLEEYIQVDAFLTYWNDDVISPGSIEFSNNYETDMNIFREGGHKETKKLWIKESPRFTKDNEFIEIVKNETEKYLFARNKAALLGKYEKYLLRFEDQIQFSVRSNLKSGHCNLNLIGGLLTLKKEIEQYEVVVTCTKKKKKHATKKCTKI